MTDRQKNWDQAERNTFDVAIIGGGINGSCLYHRLCCEGYKVLLIDKGDFSCGTSQASAMMVWGGLLYLRNLDVLSVCRLSRSRDAMIKDRKTQVSRRLIRYIPAPFGGRNKHMVHLSLYLYWGLGRFHQSRPLSQEVFKEAELVKGGSQRGSLVYEEAVLNSSDSRFVMHWIAPHHSPDRVALNYCSLTGGQYAPKDRCWYLELQDTFGERQISARAGYVVNCAGVWADAVNQRFQIRSPYKHVLSKGVFIGFKRPKAHATTLIFEMGSLGDVFAYIPWGPVSLWGPTETLTRDIETGFRVTSEDVNFLLDKANEKLSKQLDKSHIISVRCGIRPLVTPKSFKKNCYPLDISRRHKLAKDPDLPWTTVYGGKITSCVYLAGKISDQIFRFISPSLSPVDSSPMTQNHMEWSSYPGLKERVPSLEWCMKNEFCCTLEDYLRRRTNISQWVARAGLGHKDENLPYLKKLAMQLSCQDNGKAERMLRAYRDGVRAGFDQIIMN